MDAATSAWAGGAGAELLSAAALMTLTVLIHGSFVFLAAGWLEARLERHAARDVRPGMVERFALINTVVLLMLVAHLLEMAVWAGFFVVVGAVADPRQAFYFAAVTYTTLGYEDTKLPQGWQLLAPSLATAGVLMFGWTTGTLVTVVTALNAIRRRPRKD